MYISFFMLGPYCLDYCSFVVYSEVGGYFSSSVFPGLLWLLGRSFVFLYKLKLFYLSSMKNATGNLIGIALILYIALGSIVSLTIGSSNPITWYIFPSVCVIFNFFYQHLMVFRVQIFYLLR